MRNAPGNLHFLARPSGIAFGFPGSLATAQEEDQITQPTTPADFMGPTLWTSNLTIFDGGHGGHIDMLHNSPNSAGIAWETGNTYWLFDGWNEALVRYDFRTDHGPGGADHSDGVVGRYVSGQVSYVPGISSHMQVDGAAGLLYVADTGNNRIGTLALGSGSRGGAINPNYDGVDQHMMMGARVETLIEGADHDLVMPCGLHVEDGVLYITDAETARIYGFNAADGAFIDYLDLSSELEAGALQGITLGPDGALYFVDTTGNRLLRVAAKE